jgi:hypothetical protein
MADTEQEAETLYRHGADYVLLPHYINGMHLARILTHTRPASHITELKRHHLKALGI